MQEHAVEFDYGSEEGVGAELAMVEHLAESEKVKLEDIWDERERITDRINLIMLSQIIEQSNVVLHLI